MTEDVLLPRIATVTSKMQLTLPVAFRRKHHLKPGDKVQLEVRNGRIVLTPYHGVLDDFSGSRTTRESKERHRATVEGAGAHEKR